MSSVDIEAEKKLIIRLNQEWIEAEVRKDIEFCMKLVSEDIIFQPPNMLPILGKEAVRELGTEFVKHLVSASSEVERIEVSASGDLAYIMLSCRYVMEGSVVEDLNVLKVWKKVGGEWKLVAGCFNSQKPSE